MGGYVGWRQFAVTVRADFASFSIEPDSAGMETQLFIPEAWYIAFARHCAPLPLPQSPIGKLEIDPVLLAAQRIDDSVRGVATPVPRPSQAPSPNPSNQFAGLPPTGDRRAQLDACIKASAGVDERIRNCLAIGYRWTPDSAGAYWRFLTPPR